MGEDKACPMRETLLQNPMEPHCPEVREWRCMTWWGLGENGNKNHPPSSTGIKEHRQLGKEMGAPLRKGSSLNQSKEKASCLLQKRSVSGTPGRQKIHESTCTEMEVAGAWRPGT